MTRKRRKSQQQKQNRTLRTEKLEDRIVFSGLTMAPGQNYIFKATDNNDKIVVNFTSAYEGEISIKTTDSNGVQVGQPTVESFSLANLTNCQKVKYHQPFLTIKGRDGNDHITILDNGFATKNRFEFQVAVDGQKGNDFIQGSNFDERLTGGKNGKQWLKTNGSNQILWDTIHGSGGDDRIEGGPGTDHLYGDGGDDFIKGNDGDDIIEGGSGEDVISGGWGRDTIRGGDNDDILLGGADPDEIYGEGGDDTIRGGSNFDVGQSLNNLSFWSVPIVPKNIDNHDQLYGGIGNDTIFGDSGSDYIHGGIGMDVLYGGDGSDTIYGGDEMDHIEGGKGRDYIEGGNGDDYLYGNDGRDNIFGNAGNDRLSGGQGMDDLHGGLNDDHLWGGYESLSPILSSIPDRLWGDDPGWYGNDTFYKVKWTPGAVVDKVMDKQSGDKVKAWYKWQEPWVSPLV